MFSSSQTNITSGGKNDFLEEVRGGGRNMILRENIHPAIKSN